MVGDHWSLTRFATLATTSFPVVLLSSPSVVYEGNYFDPFFPFILWQNDPKYGNLQRNFHIYLTETIPDICHHRHHQRWCTFFKPAYFFPQRTRMELLLAKFIQRIKTQICTFLVMKISNAPSQILNVTTFQCQTKQRQTKTKLAKQKPSMSNKSSGMSICIPKYYAVFRETIFVANLPTFLRTFYRPKNMVAYNT